MHWVIQENVAKEAKFDEMIQALERRSIPHSIHKVVPFSGDLIPEPPERFPPLYIYHVPVHQAGVAHPRLEAVHRDRPVWCMGSISLAHTAKKYGWRPGVVSTDDFDFEVQKAIWGSKMLNHDAIIKAVVDEEKHQDYRIAYLMHGITDELHVRPLNDSKVIKGQIMSCAEMDEWVATAKQNEVPLDFKLMFSPIKQIYQEVRYWVVGGEIVGKSLYRLGETVLHSQDMIDPDVTWFASAVVHMTHKVLRDPRLPEAYCLDCCSTPDGPKIVEVNNINSSGLYAVNVGMLVEAIQDHWMS